MLTGKFSRKQEFLRPEIIKFADPLKQAAHALLGIPYSCEYYEKEFGNEWKNKEGVEFFGKTPRSEYIALSETYAKERHGQDVFGKIAARRIQLSKGADVFIIPDSGFVAEAVPVISYVGINNVYVIELSRRGCSFTGDSRGYIRDGLAIQFPKLQSIRLPNDQDQKFLTTLLKGVVSKFLNFEVEF